MTLASNTVQVETKVSFAGYIIDRNTQYPDPKKLQAVTKFTLATTQKAYAYETSSIIMCQGWQGNKLNSGKC